MNLGSFFRSPHTPPPGAANDASLEASDIPRDIRPEHMGDHTNKYKLLEELQGLQQEIRTLEQRGTPSTTTLIQLDNLRRKQEELLEKHPELNPH